MLLRTTPEFCETGKTSRPVKVMWIWHAAVVAEYQKPLSSLASCPQLDVTLLVPKRWPERAGQMVAAESLAAANFRLIKAPSLFTGLYYVYFFPGLLLYFLKYRPDIIYCYEEPHALISALVLLLRRLFFPRSAVFLYAAQNIKKKYPVPFRWFERYCFKHTDLIIACGTRVAETLRSKGYRGELRVVPLSVDVETYRPDAGLRKAGRDKLALPENAVLACYAGKLVEEKGSRTLWAAFERVARQYPDAHLLLAGRGPLLGELREAAQHAGLADRLHTPGVVHNSQLPMYMNASDVFVLPSETRKNWREQFGRVIVEAMSCGTAVVGSDSGEIPTVVGDAGLLFHEGDANALADCLKMLLTDRALRKRLGKCGRERALSMYSVEKVAAQHYSLYREYVARG